jgi:hypothetical protein
MKAGGGRGEPPPLFPWRGAACLDRPGACWIQPIPHAVELPTRFADVDPPFHINDVAMAALFQEGRVRLAYHLQQGLREQDLHTFIVSAHLEYFGQIYYPDPITMMMAIETVGGLVPRGAYWRNLS